MSLSGNLFLLSAGKHPVQDICQRLHGIFLFFYGVQLAARLDQQCPRLQMQIVAKTLKINMSGEPRIIFLCFDLKLKGKRQILFNIRIRQIVNVSVSRSPAQPVKKHDLRYLFAIDLDRSKNCYIANIVKCRPPQNRDPLPTESEACMPWLREQFKLLQPKIVVCLGRIASQRMIRTDFSVTKEHGTFVQKNGVWFMGTFHPAALLRQAQNKPAAFADFVALREKIHEVCGHTY